MDCIIEKNENFNLIGHEDFRPVNNIIVFESFRYVVSSGLDCQVRIWNLSNQTCVAMIPFEKSVCCIEKMGKNGFLLSTLDGEVYFYRLYFHSPIYRLMNEIDYSQYQERRRSKYSVRKILKLPDRNILLINTNGEFMILTFPEGKLVKSWTAPFASDKDCKTDIILSNSHQHCFYISPHTRTNFLRSKIIPYVRLVNYETNEEVMKYVFPARLGVERGNAIRDPIIPIVEVPNVTELDSSLTHYQRVRRAKLRIAKAKARARARARLLIRASPGRRLKEWVTRMKLGIIKGQSIPEILVACLGGGRGDIAFFNGFNGECIRQIERKRSVRSMRLIQDNYLIISRYRKKKRIVGIEIIDLKDIESIDSPSPPILSSVYFKKSESKISNLTVFNEAEMRCDLLYGDCDVIRCLSVTGIYLDKDFLVMKDLEERIDFLVFESGYLSNESVNEGTMMSLKIDMVGMDDVFIFKSLL